MERLAVVVTLAALVLGVTGVADEAIEIYFVSHANPASPFWNQLVVGFHDACKELGVKGQWLSPTTFPDYEWQLRTLQTLIDKGAKVIITTIPQKDMFDDVIAYGRSKGVCIIASNTDDPEGAAGNARVAYIGLNEVVAGYSLAKKMLTELWPGGPPDPEEVYVLQTLAVPGITWTDYRSKGELQFFAEYGIPDDHVFQVVTTEDIPVAKTRISPFLLAHPEVNMIISVGVEIGGAYLAAKELGIPPGKVLMGGFDLFPLMYDGLEEGYIAVTVDQQPYLQGYLPVVFGYLYAKYGFTPCDVNTGVAFRTKEDVPTLRAIEEMISGKGQ